MGIPLPAELQGVLALVGLQWPATDEAVLLSQAKSWFDLCTQAAHDHEDAITAVGTMSSTNLGRGISAFLDSWDEVAGPNGVLQTQQLIALSQADAGLLVGAAVTLCKESEIGYLVAAVVIIDAAIAGAVSTRGASLLAAGRQLALVRALVKSVIEICVATIRGIALVQGQLGPVLELGSARIAGRAIHTGSDSTTANAGDINQRLARAQTLARTKSGGRHQAFSNVGAPNTSVKRVNPQTGEITAYVEYDAQGRIKKRVDLLVGSKPHYDKRTKSSLPAPHVVEYEWHSGPDGSAPKVILVRPADPEEIP